MRGNVRVHQRKIVARRRKRALIFFSVTLGALALLLGGFALLTHARFLAISEVRVSGNTRLSETYVKTLADEKLAGNYLGMFSRRAVLIYPHDAIESALRELPVVRGVTIEADGFHVVDIQIEERVEAARFCLGDAGDFSSCFAVDEGGFAFSPSEDASMIVYRNASTTEPIGRQVYDENQFKNLKFFVRELISLGATPREIVAGEAGYVDIILVDGGKLVVNTSDDLSDVLANLSSILNDRTIASSPEAFLSKLEYIRLDAGNKVFYKLGK